MGISGIGAEGLLLDLIDSGTFSDAFEVRALFVEIDESGSSFSCACFASLRLKRPITEVKEGE